MSLQISAVEFLKSEQTSNGVVLLKDEDIVKVVAGGNNGARAVRMENATRFALVLTRSFIQFSVLPELQNCNGAVDLSFLLLDDFFVTFEERNIPDDNGNGSHLSTYCALLGIDNFSPERLDQKVPATYITPMQVLGFLLYSVFSFGQPPPAHLITLAQSTASHERQINNGSDDESRFGKHPRPTETTVFSTLVEGNRFPVSICRFLSNLIDIGPGGKSDYQFTKFGDVIEELQEMIAKPELLLHDSTSTLIEELDVPMFGHLYHGRKAEFDELMSVATQIEQSTTKRGVQAMFIAGIAGCGKTSLVGAVSDKLLDSRWIVIHAKFEQHSVEKSRCVVSSMFDEIIKYLVKMKESEVPSNVAYCNTVSQSILDVLGMDTLSGLVYFLPTLALLFDNVQSIEANENDSPATEADWQLVYSLSTILEVALESDRCILICCDDLHASERSSFSLIAEVLINLGGRDIGKRVFFTGIYRENEIKDDDHPFLIQYSHLQLSSSINANEMKLSSLSKEDVLGIIQQQFKLPRRYLVEMADVIHKKSGGHALYAVTLLNSLFRDSIITYSSQKLRFCWDDDRISIIDTGDDVAELIASNLESLTPMCQRALRILACFGIQTDLKLLRYLDRFEKGTLILTSLKKFVERGILDRTGTLVIFCHDLILQAAYNSLSLAEKTDLHLRLGQFLGTLANANTSSDPVTRGMNKLKLNDGSFFTGRSMTSSLISIACDQVNSAGPGSISDRGLILSFAKWNLKAGQESSKDFLAALHYYGHGILFLQSFGRGYWSVDPVLCLALHNGAAVSAFALGEHDKVTMYAREVAKHAAFEDTLEAQAVLLKSLNQRHRVEECLSTGIDVLRKLGFDIPLDPSYPNIMQAIASTEAVASQFSFDQMVSLRDKVMDPEKRKIGVIMDAFMGACYYGKNGTAFLPIISCETVKFALCHGIFEESTSAFASYSMMRIFNQGDYEGALKWSRVVRAVTEKRGVSSESIHRFEARSHIILYAMVDVWFYPARVISKNLISYYQNAMTMGQIDVAMVALQTTWTYMILGGEKLQLISQHIDKNLRLVLKHSARFTKYCYLDNALLYALKGKSGNPFTAFQSSISSIEDLQSEALAQSDTNLLHRVHFYSFLLAYWREDFVKAEEHSHKILMMFPVCKMPSIYLLFHTFFRGLVAFRLFRTLGDDKRLKEGVDAINEFGKWMNNSKPTFHNKLLLLQAEHEATKPENREAAISLYKESIQSARDHGYVHELALSCKVFGDYYAFNGNQTEAIEKWKDAVVYFNQWGAAAVADRLVDCHQLERYVDLSTPSPPLGNCKREWRSINGR